MAAGVRFHGARGMGYLVRAASRRGQPDNTSDRIREGR
jgi:hypothetical protein